MDLLFAPGDTSQSIDMSMMALPSLRLGPDDLLEYNSTYGVLICRKCQYAIQKPAVDRHLLKHKIYRGQRRQLLDTIETLHLLDADDVRLPPPDAEPIESLPVIPGWRCSAIACNHLCASGKRMRQHWLDLRHGDADWPRGPTVMDRVLLQTFFRGIKVKYFQVSGPTESLAWPSESPPAMVESLESFSPGHDEQSDVFVWPESQSLSMESGLVEPAVHDLEPMAIDDVLPEPDLDAIKYFYHFTTKTWSTLPGLPHSATYDFENTHTNIIALALDQKWLLCGLLALAARHLAMLADDADTVQTHTERSHRYQMAFVSGYNHDYPAGGERGLDTPAALAAVNTAEYLWSTIHFDWGGALPSLDPAGTFFTSKYGRVTDLLHAFRSTAATMNDRNTSTTVSGSSNAGRPRSEESFAEATRILDMRRARWAAGLGSESAVVAAMDEARSAGEGEEEATLLQVREALYTLPNRIADHRARPANAQEAREVLAMMSAVAALVECCDHAYGERGQAQRQETLAGRSDTVQTAWSSTAEWASMVGGDFSEMLSRASPAAMVVTAHWAVLLLGRAERRGCWLVSGMARRAILAMLDEMGSGEEVGWAKEQVGNLLRLTPG